MPAIGIKEIGAPDSRKSSISRRSKAQNVAPRARNAGIRALLAYFRRPIVGHRRRDERAGTGSTGGLPGPHAPRARATCSSSSRSMTSAAFTLVALGSLVGSSCGPSFASPTNHCPDRRGCTGQRLMGEANDGPQQEGPDEQPEGDERERPEVIDRELDEQVARAPHEAKGQEDRPVDPGPARVHRGIIPTIGLRK